MLEDRQGRVVGVEVKASLTVRKSDFGGLRRLKEVAGARFQRGAVLYPGPDLLEFGEDLFAVPLAHL